jgi:hypothetical protein
MNNVEMQWFAVRINNDIFPSKIRPEKYGFFILLHYPNQLLTSTNTLRHMWPKRETNDTYEMKFTVTGTEIITRRDKSKHPCNQDWKIHDSIVQMRHSEMIGCRTPYQNLENKLRACSSRNEMKKAVFALRYDDYGYVPPCKSMEKITYSYMHIDLSDTEFRGTGSFWIGIYHENQNFKDIVQIR